MTGLWSTNRLGAHVRRSARFFCVLNLCLTLPIAAAAQPINCSDIKAVERENEQSWLKLEMEYPILLPTISDCFNKSAMIPADQRAFHIIVVCAILPCSIAKKLSGDDVCTPLVSQVIQYHFKKDAIQQRKHALSCA